MQNNIKLGPTYLYNLNMFITEESLIKFQGIKYVCMQGSGDRAKHLAQKLAKEILGIEETYFTPTNLFNNASFEGYRVGNILSVSHGMGTISVMNLLEEVTILMKTCGNDNLEYIRIGTSGGINIEPGSVILTDTAYKPDLTPGYKVTTLGKDIFYPTQMDKKLNQRILRSQPETLGFNLYEGNSISAEDFFLGQARMDGTIKPKYTLSQRQEYFKKIIEKNIYNFEMEATALAAFCHRAHIPATMVAVTILNRIEGDQVSLNKESMLEFSERSQKVIINYLLSQAH